MKFVTWVKVLLTLLFWGASFVATKIVLREISPLAVITLRFGIGVPVLAVMAAARGELRLPGKNDWGWLVFLGLNGVTVHQLLQSTGLLTTTAANSGWIVALIPIFSALLAWLILREPFGRTKMAGLALATCGAFLVISRGQLSRGVFNLPATPGDFLMLLSAPNWALFTVLSKRVMSRLSPALTVTYVMAFGWLAILPLFLGARGWLEAPRLTLAGWGGVLFLGVLCSGLAYVFWYDALDDIGASRLTSFQYLQPLVTVMIAARLLGESLTWAMLLGGATILIGVWLVNRSGGVDITRAKL